MNSPELNAKELTSSLGQCGSELKLIVEIDGEPQLTDEGRERDRIRDQFLKEVIREDGNAHERIWEIVKAAVDALGCEEC